jgi:hypothetical protein
MQAELANHQIQVQPVSDAKSNLPAQVQNLINQIPDLAKKSELEDCLLFCLKNGTELKLLSYRLKPETKYNWMDIIVKFAQNYANPNPDSDNLYRWGQIVPESGEYLCRDCGYIDTFQAGQVFPVCEVCLAGDPEGPVEIQAGFWEKI